MDLSHFLDSFVAAVADRVAERLTGPKAPERIPLSQVTQHGAPSTRWVTARAREGAITLHGPRGGRFVYSAELAALLATTTIPIHPSFLFHAIAAPICGNLKF